MLHRKRKSVLPKYPLTYKVHTNSKKTFIINDVNVSSLISGCNWNIPHESGRMIPPRKMTKPFTYTEIEKVVSKLKNGKSPGHDTITAEQRNTDQPPPIKS